MEPVDSSTGSIYYPRTYKVRSNRRLFICFIGSLLSLLIFPFTLFSLVMTVTSLINGGVAIIGSIVITVLLCLLTYYGISIALNVLKQKVILNKDSIEIIGFRQKEQILRSDIMQYKPALIEDASYEIFVKPLAKKIALPINLAKDDYFDRWFKDIPNVTVINKQIQEKAQAKLINDTRWGETPEARKAIYDRDSRITTILCNIASAACLFAFFGDSFYPVILFIPLLLTLIILPLIAIALQIYAKGYFKLFNFDLADARPPLFLLFAFPSPVLAFIAYSDIYVFHAKLLIIYSIIAGICLALQIRFLDKNIRFLSKPFGALVLLCMLYCYGTLLIINVITDKHPQEIITADVIGKDIFHSRGIYRYYLTLNPSKYASEINKMRVPISLYNAREAGDKVCIYTYSGALNIPWYNIQPCE